MHFITIFMHNQTNHAYMRLFNRKAIGSTNHYRSLKYGKGFEALERSNMQHTRLEC